jgi:hypothetical protein
MSIFDNTGGGGIKYTSVTSTPFSVLDIDLIEGTNIFGVNVAAETTITLPPAPAPGKVIMINDESGNASVNNIIIQA